MLQIAKMADLALGWLSWAAAALSALTVILIALVTAASVIPRTTFGVVVLDALVPGRIGMTLIVFLGAAWALRQDKHVRVEIVSQALPLRWRRSIRACMMSLALIVVSILTWESWDFALAALRMNEQIIGDVRIPAFPFQLVIPGGLMLLALEMLRRIVRDVAAVRRRELEREEDAEDTWN